MRDYQNMVYSTAYRLLADASEAEDISQEVFLKAYEHFGDLRLSQTAGGWLKTVTRNLCLSHITRRRSRWRLFSEMEHDDEDSARFSETLAAPDEHHEAIAAADRKELLSKSLERLPAAQRVALVLYHYHDLSYEAIAAQLNVSLSKVKTDIHRARETLRKHLSRDPELNIS